MHELLIGSRLISQICLDTINKERNKFLNNIFQFIRYFPKIAIARSLFRRIVLTRCRAKRREITPGASIPAVAACFVYEAFVSRECTHLSHPVPLFFLCRPPVLSLLLPRSYRLFINVAPLREHTRIRNSNKVNSSGGSSGRDVPRVPARVIPCYLSVIAFLRVVSLLFLFFFLFFSSGR
ncbi:hypothetical protein PUN28_015710 [Cardiocondyla obscurior]|uniref:Transmembrane protein n=1 Tax=Cardiocondyla obscurior TaxID=286306 RepID=A0AAW2F0E8_9HYME